MLLASLSEEQILRDCGAVTDEGVTYAALILFGKSRSVRKYLARSEIIFEYRSSDASGPASQRVEFTEAFFTCYDRIWELINLRNDRQHYQEGLFVFSVPTFNERVGLDKDTNKELLLKHIRENNGTGTTFNELQQVLPGHSRNQIQVMMRELKADGKIECLGKTHSAKWYALN